MDVEQDEKMEMVSLSIEDLNSHPAANDNEAFASKEDEAFAIRRAPIEDKAFAMHPAAKENEAYVVCPGEMDSGADMIRAGHRAAKLNRGLSRHSSKKENEAFTDHPTKKDHLAIDVIAEENDGEERDADNVLEARDGLDQDAELDDQAEDENEIEEPPVEMCDQEVQTDLSTLDMDDITLYELFGDPIDESL